MKKAKTHVVIKKLLKLKSIGDLKMLSRLHEGGLYYQIAKTGNEEEEDITLNDIFNLGDLPKGYSIKNKASLKRLNSMLTLTKTSNSERYSGYTIDLSNEYRLVLKSIGFDVVKNLLDRNSRLAYSTFISKLKHAQNEIKTR